MSKSLVRILQRTGIRFAILGVEEKCTGDLARRAGNEMMFQMMARENIETLNNYNVKKIIAACPHCLNTLKHEYPQIQPRSILKSIYKDGLKELERHGRESFCCGAGGGRMWMEETIGKRINLARSEEIVAQQVSNVAVGCPFCLTMIEDGMKDFEKEETINTMDIAELVEKSIA